MYCNHFVMLVCICIGIIGHQSRLYSVYLSISVAAGQQLKLRFELESGNWRDESMEISPCTSTQPTISFFFRIQPTIRLTSFMV